jgi:hypothetical protein
MKYKCSNGHETHADSLPERCPVCGSSLLRALSPGSPVTPSAPASASLGGPPPAAPSWRAEEQPPLAPPPAATPAPRRRWRLLALAALAALAALGVLGGLLYLLFGGKDTDRRVAEMAKQCENAVGVVILAGQRHGQPFSTPVATAWAIGEKVFVSNGHVTQPVAAALSNGFAAFIVLNKNPEKKLQVTEVVTHPACGRKLVNMDGKETVVPACDLGLLRVDAAAPNRFRVAPDSELKRLDSGYRVAYLGFPMENMQGQGVDVRSPVANMQSGIITSTTDWWLSKAPFEKSLLLSHNLAAAGGASGSPIFNAQGRVVGVLSAGNVSLQLDARTGQVTRTPSAALINFAQRIDILRDIYPEYSR